MIELLKKFQLDFRGEENIPSVICDNWQAFSSLIESFNHVISDNILVFRGQRRRDWELTPSLGRFSKNGIIEEKIAKEQIKLFRKTIRGRIHDHSLLMDEDGIQEDELWSIGQHYGLYTPLLDWTHSPYVALYFAFEKEDIDTEPDNEYRVVYVLNKTLLEKLSENNDEKLLRFIEPKKDDHGRLVSQAGLFTISTFGQTLENAINDSISGKLENLPDGEDIYEISEYIFKILVKNENQKSILKYLRQMNIHPASLFPDLIGAANNCNLLINEKHLYKNTTEKQLEEAISIEPVKYNDEGSDREKPEPTERPLSLKLKDRDSLCAILNIYGKYSFIVDEFLEKVQPYLDQPDWEKRESILAQIRNLYRVILRRNGFPENYRDEIIESMMEAVKND